MLDLTMLLSSSLVIVNIPELKMQRQKRIFGEEKQTQYKDNWLEFITQEVAQSMARIVCNSSVAKRGDSLWPSTAYLLQPFKTDRLTFEAFDCLFATCSFI
jgi:hypothetical protein